jgi:hypothetical protein
MFKPPPKMTPADIAAAFREIIEFPFHMRLAARLFLDCWTEEAFQRLRTRELGNVHEDDVMLVQQFLRYFESGTMSVDVSLATLAAEVKPTGWPTPTAAPPVGSDLLVEFLREIKRDRGGYRPDEVVQLVRRAWIQGREEGWLRAIGAVPDDPGPDQPRRPR